MQWLINFDFVSINFWTKSNFAILCIFSKVCKKEYWNLQEVFNLYQYWMTNVLSALNKINYRLWWQLWGLQFPEDFQKFRNAGSSTGGQAFKVENQIEKRKLESYWKGSWGTHLFSKGRRRSKLQMEIKETFLCPCYLAFKKKNSCITENNSFSNHKSDYEALQGCKLFLKAKEPEKVDNETFSLGLNATGSWIWPGESSDLFLQFFRVLQ